jgi:hypothetical protein
MVAPASSETRKSPGHAATTSGSKHAVSLHLRALRPTRYLTWGALALDELSNHCRDRVAGRREDADGLIAAPDS